MGVFFISILMIFPIWSFNSVGNKDILAYKMGSLNANSNNGLNEGMVLVEGGAFPMGSDKGDDDEKPVHKIELNSFYMDKYEVTNAEFCEFLNLKGNQSEGGSYWLEIGNEDCSIAFANGKFNPKSGREKQPVIEISWYGAVSYSKWKGKRLPTEAEWEYAARGGKKSKNFIYAGSNTAAAVAWYDANSHEATCNIGTKLPNELGLFDMSGNVWEWCSDWYSPDYYKSSPPLNPMGPIKALEFKVLRGGSWVSVASELRTNKRDFAKPQNANYLNGFRCAKNAI